MILRVGVVICVVSIAMTLSHSSIARPADQDQNNADAAAMGAAVVGIASTYNPFRPGYRSGGMETASGELYDQAASTAAIQTNLRERFGGVRYGRNYRPTYALVSSQDKQVIVKINDVGPFGTRSRNRLERTNDALFRSGHATRTHPHNRHTLAWC
jgi:rare lipoprotein A